MKLLALTFKGIIYLVLMLGLSSCITTDYKPVGGITVIGFSETQLAPNKFRVSFHGLTYESKQRIRDLALLRSAEVSIENGFKYFSIVDERDLSYTVTTSLPMYSYTSGNIYGGGFNANTSYYGGGSNTSETPIFTNTIVCYNNKPKDFDGYDAAFLVNSLKKAYDITPENTK
jgi:hypothetical protein